ncbi:hypothetical protein [Comamonas brasiliensis]|uniref:hypothetical protein n=1 Tax=Comamonas brasiliensis TaxID=1812482 RepID=UPI001B8C8949|nr:hypothetical protein [Comamonas sp. PE63]
MKMQVRETGKCNIAAPAHAKPSQNKKSPIAKIYPSPTKTSHSKMDSPELIGKNAENFSKREDLSLPHEEFRAQFCAPH